MVNCYCVRSCGTARFLNAHSLCIFRKTAQLILMPNATCSEQLVFLMLISLFLPNSTCGQLLSNQTMQEQHIYLNSHSLSIYRKTTQLIFCLIPHAVNCDKFRSCKNTSFFKFLYALYILKNDLTYLKAKLHMLSRQIMWKQNVYLNSHSLQKRST